MRSMTGYGRGCASNGDNQATVEITAVNSRKQVEMRFALPRELAMLEPELRQRIQEKLSRGNLNVAITYRLAPSFHASQAHIDIELGVAVANELRRLASAARLAGEGSEPSLANLLQVPGVILTSDSGELDPIKPLVLQALDTALDGLGESRKIEGMRLKEDLMRRGENMARLVEAIASRTDEAVCMQRQRLRERMAALGLELNLDDERLVKEVAFYAEKADITEEVVRLKSHLQQYDVLLNTDEEPGRALDFLGQEMSREINTLSAKTADLSIAKVALELKGEINRVREQVMNIE